MEEDSDIDSNSLHDLLLGLADSDQPQDKTVNKVSYPKRLLDNTMKKRYAKAGFTEEKLDFLHKFFQGAVNLYGVIEIIDLSQIYADIKDKNQYPDISTDEFIKFAELVRREQVPYYVFDQHELFRNRIDYDFERIIVNEDLLGPEGLHSLEGVYNVYYSNYASDYWKPEDMLAFAGHQQEKEEQALLDFFTKLGNQADESKELAKKIVDHFIWTCKGRIKDVDPLPKAQFMQLLAHGNRTVDDELQDQLLELNNNYNRHRHVYLLKGWTTDEWSTNPDAQGEKAEQLKAMPRLLGLIEKDS
ncbi:hypothetical protein ME807_04860 [Lactobacillus delbrueckii]|nr:hypothetical protein ME807_04860 [Lactobacillus delbrueckii]